MTHRRWLAGRYELVDLIGSGGHGRVWRAIDRGGGYDRPVCVKTGALGASEEAARDLAEEARLLARVRHANLVSLLDVVRDEHGAPALVLELVEGCDLRRLRSRAHRPCRSRGLVPDDVAVHVACSILRGLSAAVRAIPGLVHRDVTPHNVLVSNDGEVKLADFGIALATARARVTSPLYVKGKLGYMAPEQVRGEVLDARTDLFAVGVVLYELLAGSRPHGAAAGLSELARVERGELTPITEVRRLDRRLSTAVSRLLAHRREDRPSSPQEALAELAPLGSGDLGCLQLAHIARTMEYKRPLHARPRAETRPERARAVP